MRHLFTAPILAISMLSSCSTLKPDADPVVVHAEQSLAIAHETFEIFLKLDDANRDFIRSNAPAVHTYAEYLRVKEGNPPVQRNIGWVESALAVKNAYKGNRTPENRASLSTALATLDRVLAETQRHLDNGKSAVTKKGTP